MLRFALPSLAVVLALVAIAGAGQRPLRLRLTPFDVAPGGERLPCEYRPLPNTEPMDIRRFVVRAQRGLHHIQLYAYLGQDRDPRHFTNELVEGLACFLVGPPDVHEHSAGLLGAVRPGVYDLPAGYAVSILPEQPVSVVTHAFNPTGRTRRTAVRVKMVPARAGTVRHHLVPLDVLALSFSLSPHATTVHTADFVAPVDLSVAMVSSHQHQFGTRATIWPVVGGAEGAPVYENRRWSEPPIRWLDPPIRLDAGDRLRIRCEWNNTSDDTLVYGGSAHDEMCNLNGYVFFDRDPPPGERTGIGGILVPVAE